MSELRFDPAPSGKDCTEKAGGWGLKSALYDYIWKGDMDESTYPADACPPRYHGNAQIDNLQVNATCGKASVTNFVGATVTLSGLCAAGSFSSQSKLFDIPHPSKKDNRLRHGCLEGPELGVYVRGHLKDTNVIELPDYWSDLVDPESITVSLTQIGSSQDLIVDSIDWGRQVKVRSGNGTNINCYYIVNAMRKDIPVLEVEVDA